MDKIIFTDFDGTITKQDTCNAMSMAFARGDYEAVDKLWREKKISTQECTNTIFKMFDADLDDVRNLIDTIELDDYFKQFLSLCREKGYRVYVLSDGYDFNIKTIFKKYGIDLPYFSNHIVYDNGFRMECPNQGDDCKRCGTCKLELMQKLKNSGQAVYIGDGYSDVCPAMHADIVFAKNNLYRVCTEKGIKTIPFTNYKDIIDSGIL